MFSAFFGVAYALCFYFDVSLFKYYPQTNAMHLTHQPAAAGPPIAWYGWLASAAVISTVLALIVPRRVAERWHELPWIVTVAVLAALLVYERRWFF